jgi:hypothetical protein
MMSVGSPDRDRFDLVDQEQLAAQLVAVMDAHFQRPDSQKKRHILRLAANQIEAKAPEAIQPIGQESP